MCSPLLHNFLDVVSIPPAISAASLADERPSSAQQGRRRFQRTERKMMAMLERTHMATMRRAKKKKANYSSRRPLVQNCVTVCLSLRIDDANRWRVCVEATKHEIRVDFCLLCVSISKSLVQLGVTRARARCLSVAHIHVRIGKEGGGSRKHTAHNEPRSLHTHTQDSCMRRVNKVR